MKKLAVLLVMMITILSLTACSGGGSKETTIAPTIAPTVPVATVQPVTQPATIATTAPTQPARQVTTDPTGTTEMTTQSSTQDTTDNQNTSATEATTQDNGESHSAEGTVISAGSSSFVIETPYNGNYEFNYAPDGIPDGFTEGVYVIVTYTGSVDGDEMPKTQIVNIYDYGNTNNDTADEDINTDDTEE